MRRTLDSKEEYNLQQATNSQLDFILSQNSFNFEITTYSDKVNSIIQTIIDLKNTEMIITSDLNSKFTIRNVEYNDKKVHYKKPQRLICN